MRRLEIDEVVPLRAALEELAQRNDALRLAHRLHALLLVGLGHSCAEVAGWFGEHPRTIERWVHSYLSCGVGALRSTPSHGRRPALAQPQLLQLGQELACMPMQFGYRHRRWSGKLLQRHLDEHYGVRLGLRQCQRLLSRNAAPHELGAGHRGP